MCNAAKYALTFCEQSFYTFLLISLGFSLSVGSPVEEPPLMCTVTANQNNICPNTPIQLTYSGFGASCSVTWFTGPNGTGSNLGSANPLTLSPVASTTYYARPTGFCICSGEEQITIIVGKTFSTVGTAMADTNNLCPGTPVKLTHSGFVLGSGAGTVSWFTGPNGTGQPLGQANPLTVSPTSTSFYFAYSSGTCNDVQTAVQVTVNQTLSQVGTLAADTTTLCPGDTAQLSHAGFVLGSGATAVGWFTGPRGSGNALGTTPNLTVSPDTTTTYYAFLEGICNQVEDSITITAWQAPLADAGRDALICNGESAQIGGVMTGSGGTPSYHYEWSPVGDLSSAVVANPVASPPTNTSYTVFVIDSNGCRDTSEMEVLVKDIPNIQMVTAMDPTTCMGEDGKLAITANANSGSLHYRVINFQQPDTLPWKAQPIFSQLEKGLYQVEVEYAQMPQCRVQGLDTFLLSEPLPPFAEILLAPEMLCEGEKGMFQALEDTGDVTYSWDFVVNGSSDILVGPGPLEISFQADGLATVRLVASRNLCTAETTTQVSILPNPTIDFSGPGVQPNHSLMVSSGSGIRLTLETTPASEITWTAEVVAGAVTGLEEAGQGNEIQDVLTLIEGRDSAVVRYHIVATSGDCRDSATFRVRVLVPLFIPNLVSPNGDGWNDTWKIRVNEVDGFRKEDFSVAIFNRSGGRVYQAPVTQPWDGENCPDGTYWYKLDNKFTGETFSGSITLIRN